jgi:glyoxylase-like metal-dependent hydrolase (beta-lactamase superfamily II)
MRIRSGATLVALCAGLALIGSTSRSVVGQERAAPAQPLLAIPLALPSDGYFEIRERLAPGVHVIRQAQPFHVWPSSNVVVFEQSDGLVLVDAGNSPGAGDRVVRLIREISDKPVKAVILTHGHYDHLYGLVSIRREWPQARIIATRATHDYVEGRRGYWLRYGPEEELRNQQAFRDIAQTYMRNSANREDWPTESERAGLRQAAREHQQAAFDRVGTFRILPDITFTDRYVIADRDNPVEARFIGRANTHGDAIVWAPRSRVVAAGDIVVSPVPFGSGIYAHEMVDTVNRLREIDFAVLVPGHGLPQRDRTYLEVLVRSIEAAKPGVRAMVDQGVAIEQIDQQPAALDDQLPMFGLTDPWLQWWFRRYWVRGMMRSLYREMTGVQNDYELDERPSSARAGSKIARHDIPPAA